MKVIVTLGFAAASILGITPTLGDFNLMDTPAKYTPSSSCVKWYDGCNMCDKQPDGSVTCSHRSCSEPGTGFCRISENAATSSQE